jgi:N-acetyl sugar amidotransferase
MDTSDPDISFDEMGVCNYCRIMENARKNHAFGNREKELTKLINKIKLDGKGREYDCILGISGGVDSAYLAYLARQYGLRVLAVHVDCGWNSEIAVSNIQKLCSKLGYDLHTIVVDWETIKELQRAYMFSGLANLDIPQDHAFLSATYAYGLKHHIKYMLNGSNFATEGILPKAWGYDAKDYTAIKDVYKKCGRGLVSLSKYPHMSILDLFEFLYTNKIIRINLLNYIDYSKKDAIKTLSDEFGWQYYGGKHFESRYTKFFQSYYLPEKFGYDKKRAHLSSLVVNGEMTREEALGEMNDSSAYTEEEMLEDRDYILKKLDISQKEWDEIMRAPCKTEDDYKNYKKTMSLLRKIKHFLYR